MKCLAILSRVGVGTSMMSEASLVNVCGPRHNYLKVTLLHCKNVSVSGTVTTGVHIGTK